MTLTFNPAELIGCLLGSGLVGGLIVYFVKRRVEQRPKHEMLDLVRKCLCLIREAKPLGLNVLPVLAHVGVTVTKSTHDLRKVLKEEHRGRKLALFELLDQSAFVALLLVEMAEERSDLKEPADFARRRFCDLWESFDGPHGREAWIREIIASMELPLEYGEALYKFYEASYDCCAMPSGEAQATKAFERCHETSERLLSLSSKNDSEAENAGLREQDHQPS